MHEVWCLRIRLPSLVQVFKVYVVGANLLARVRYIGKSFT